MRRVAFRYGTLGVLALCVLSGHAYAAGCLGLAFGSAEKNRGNFEASFSANEILDIDISVLFTPAVLGQLKGDHVAEVKVFTPRGYLYQSLSVPFSSDERKKGQSAAVRGYPHAIPTQVVEPVTWNNGRSYRASVRLPVGGTTISTNSLYGSWSALAYIDGEKLPCSKAASFTINP
jgi:hypothetical protein